MSHQSKHSKQGRKKGAPHPGPHKSNSSRRSSQSGTPRRRSSGTQIGVRRIRGGAGWMLVHPRAVRDRSEDLEEIDAMIAAGEFDIAIDELRWLLGSCSEIISAHFLLGKLAVEADQDLPLARAHFGFGYQLGFQALRREKMPSPLLVLHPANQSFYDAGRGLVWCLHALDKSSMALEVIRQLLACDPSDPLGLQGWIGEIELGNKTLVTLGEVFGAKGE